VLAQASITEDDHWRLVCSLRALLDEVERLRERWERLKILVNNEAASNDDEGYAVAMEMVLQDMAALEKGGGDE
jgi:hypothetical protein